MANYDDLIKNQEFVRKVANAKKDEDILKIREEFDIDASSYNDELNEDELIAASGGGSFCEIFDSCKYECSCGAKFATGAGLENHIFWKNLGQVFKPWNKVNVHLQV